MAVVKVNGVNLHVQVLGDSGPLLFMCHGLVSGSVATWYFQFAPALAKKYRVVMYDMRGHGRSERKASGFDLDSMSADLLSLVQYFQHHYSLQSEAVSIVGHSYGALVALQLALRVAEFIHVRLENLVIIDAPLPASKYISPGMKVISGPDDTQQLAENLCSALSIDGTRSRKRLFEQIEYLYLKTSLKTDIEASGDLPDVEIQKIACRVLLVYGEVSDCLDVGYRLQALIQGAELCVLPCGHYVTLEQPQLLAEEINRFLGVVNNG